MKHWKELQGKFPAELTDMQLNLFVADEQQSGAEAVGKCGGENAFDYDSVDKIYRKLCVMDKERFGWVSQGLFLLQRVLSAIHKHNKGSQSSVHSRVQFIIKLIFKSFRENYAMGEGENYVKV